MNKISSSPSSENNKTIDKKQFVYHNSFTYQSICNLNLNLPTKIYKQILFYLYTIFSLKYYLNLNTYL